MIWLAITLFCGIAFSFWSLFDLLQPLSDLMHYACLAQVPRFEPHGVHTQALVCGANWSDAALTPSFSELGLIHLMVVSGSHLIFWRALYQHCGGVKSPLTVLSAAAFLILFCLTTKLQPPIVRALFQITAALVSAHLRLFWRADQIVAASGWACLVFFPEWRVSLSLLMSWTASLALTLDVRSKLLRAAVIYFVLLPVVLSLGSPGPFSIWSNWLLAPLLSLVLYPLSLVVVVAPILSPLLNTLWEGVGLLTRALTMHLPPPLPTIQIPKIALWVYIVALHLGIHIYSVWRARR